MTATIAVIMNIDLHCHTTASDGQLAPEQLVSLARERGLDVLSITDHDTLEAYQGIDPYTTDIRIIPGIEFSTHWQRRGIHIVGMNVDIDSDAIREGVEFQLHARQERAEKIAEKLERRGFEGCLEGAERYADGNQIGRPHFARHLVETGAVKNIQQAFKKYLGAGKPGDVREQWADLPTVIKWIKESGGIAVLAHPAKYKLTRTKLLLLVEDFIQAGGQAMEVISGLQVPSLTRDLATIANNKKLFSSCGSDFHSPNQYWAELGKVARLPEGCSPIWNTWQ